MMPSLGYYTLPVLMVLYAGDGETFTQRCDAARKFAAALPAALTGQWLFTGEIKWDVAGVNSSPKGNDYPSADLCTAVARAESLLTINRKTNTFFGVSGVYSFSRYNIKIYPPTSNTRGWDAYCTPSAADREHVTYNDGSIVLMPKVVERGSGFCEVFIEGTMGRGSDVTEYNFKLLDDNTLQRVEKNFDGGRIYKRL